jgi:hypothetical protein
MIQKISSESPDARAKWSSASGHMKKKNTGCTLEPYIFLKKIKRRETFHPNLLLNKLGDMSPAEANDVSPICPKSSHNNGV